MPSYPTSLPAPSAFPFSTRERRAASGLPGLTQLRSRAREQIIDAKGVRWIYSPAEMDIWRQWFKESLQDGQRWFTVELPGPGGWIERTARYIGGTKREHLANGVWAVTADLEISPRAVFPSTAFIFNFTGTVQTMIVPDVPDGTPIRFLAWGGGGQGGNWDHTGGAGGFTDTTATVGTDVAVGDVLEIIVGGRGTEDGAYGGGAEPGYPTAGGGGGRSAVRWGGTERVTAGGGGGGGSTEQGSTTVGKAGAGGGEQGQAGSINGTSLDAWGAGGTQSAGGVGGITANASSGGVDRAESGSAFQGGAGAVWLDRDEIACPREGGGGGGGGGYFGGGGGGDQGCQAGGGGGGGSGHPAANSTAGDLDEPPGQFNEFYNSNGRGGAGGGDSESVGAYGTHGRVVVIIG